MSKDNPNDLIKLLRAAARNKCKMDFSKAKGLTEQHHKTEVDIRSILTQFKRTGVLKTAPGASYFDSLDIPDFQSAMNIVAEGQSAFAELPSNIRFRFKNDPDNYLRFVTNPANIAELREMGLAPPAKAPPITPPVITPPTPVG